MLININQDCRSSDKNYYSYNVSENRLIDFFCNKDNSISRICLVDIRNDDILSFDLFGLYYMENLAPENEDGINFIDTDKLINIAYLEDAIRKVE